MEVTRRYEVLEKRVVRFIWKVCQILNFAIICIWDVNYKKISSSSELCYLRRRIPPDKLIDSFTLNTSIVLEKYSFHYPFGTSIPHKENYSFGSLNFSEKPCKDKSYRCKIFQYYKEAFNKECHLPGMKDQCRLSCNYCKSRAWHCTELLIQMQNFYLFQILVIFYITI